MKKDPIYRERLLKLADFLDDLPPERFEFGTWVSDGWNADEALQPQCETTACALGWTTAIPEFRALGAAIQSGSVVLTDVEDSYEADVVNRLFGLNEAELEWLFYWKHHEGDKTSLLSMNATAKDVARHIRAFIDGKSLPPSPLASNPTEGSNG